MSSDILTGVWRTPSPLLCSFQATVLALSLSVVLCQAPLYVGEVNLRWDLRHTHLLYCCITRGLLVTSCTLHRDVSAFCALFLPKFWLIIIISSLVICMCVSTVEIRRANLWGQVVAAVVLLLMFTTCDVMSSGAGLWPSCSWWNLPYVNVFCSFRYVGYGRSCAAVDNSVNHCALFTGWLEAIKKWTRVPWKKYWPIF